jgi:succinoglycan biosynthesis transport protein ExoP
MPNEQPERIMHYTQEEQPTHLLDYYHVVVKNKWVILTSLLVVVFLVMYHNARVTPIYQATTTLIIDAQSNRSPLTGQRIDYDSYLSESMTFNTHFQLITSREVLERVVKALKWGEMDEKQKSEAMREVGFLRQFLSNVKKNIRLLFGRKQEASAPEDTMIGLVQGLRGMIKTEPVEETRLLKINVVSPDPVMARDVANAVGGAYIEFNIDNRVQSSQNTLAWLTNHLYEMKKDLEDAEAEFLAFKQKASLLSPEESQRMIAQKRTDFNEAYIQARNRRLELNAKLKQLQGVSSYDGDVSHLRSLIASPLIDTLYTQLVNAEVERARLREVYKSKHPKVIEVQSKIDNTRRKMDEEVKREIANLKAEQEVLAAKEGVLEQTIADYEKEAMSTNKKELNYTILKRNVEMNQELYDTILSRLKETDITGNIDVSNIRIAEKAVTPKVPISPNRKRSLMLGVIVGLMIGLGLSFGREYLDRSLRTEEDVRRYLDLPVLAVIPVADQATEKSYGNNKPSTRTQSALKQ